MDKDQSKKNRSDSQPSTARSSDVSVDPSLSVPQLLHQRRVDGEFASGSAGFVAQDRAALAAWLSSQSAAVSVAVASRAALRSLVFYVDIFDTAETLKPHEERLYCWVSASLRASGLALLSVYAPQEEVAEALHAIVLSTQGESAASTAASAAARAALGEDAVCDAVEAVVDTVARAFNHASMDPGSTYSYAPGEAEGALAAVNADLLAFANGQNVAEGLASPLWPKESFFWRQNEWHLLRDCLSGRADLQAAMQWYDDRFMGRPLDRLSNPFCNGLDE